MTALTKSQLDSAKSAAAALDVAAKDMRVLSSLSWDNGLRAPFLTRGVIPSPEYAPVETSNAREAIASARAQIDGDHVVMQWLSRLCETLTTTANLMDARETP